MLTLMRLGWGQENPAFRQMFTSQFIPDANKEQADWFNELQRISSSPADAARNLLANGEVDVSSLLSQVKVPTLVMHARHDAQSTLRIGPAAWPRASRALASFRLKAETTSCWKANRFARFLEELRSFLASISNTVFWGWVRRQICLPTNMRHEHRDVSARRSRVVLTPRCWRQVREAIPPATVTTSPARPGRARYKP